MNSRPGEEKCSIPTQDIQSLKADGILTLKEKEVVKKLFIENKTEIRNTLQESVCDQTREQLRAFILSDYKKYFTPQILKRIQTYVGIGEGEFTQEIFYRTVDV